MVNGKWLSRKYFVTLHQGKTQEFHPSFLCEIPKNQGNSTLYQLYTNSMSTLYQRYGSSWFLLVYLYGIS